MVIPWGQGTRGGCTRERRARHREVTAPRTGWQGASSWVSRPVSCLQEWIKDTQDVTPLDKAEDREEEFVLEQVLMLQEPKAEAETPTATMTGPLSLHMGDKEVTGDPSPPPKGEELVSLGGFTFMLSDNSYVTL